VVLITALILAVSLLAGCSALQLTTTATLLPSPTPVHSPEILAPYTDTAVNPIDIDGAYSDWPAAVMSGGIEFYPGDGNQGSPTKYGTTVKGFMDDASDGHVSFYATHDGRYLYMLAIITDDQHQPRTLDGNRNQAWKEDCLHIYIDSANSGAVGIPSPPVRNQVGYEQFGVSTDLNTYTENTDFSTSGPPGPADTGSAPDQIHWLVAVSVSGSGPYCYVFEERIPLQEVPEHNLRTMIPGRSYDFNVEFCDSDGSHYLEGWIFWSSDGLSDPWDTPVKWGTIRLGKPSEP